MSGALVLGIDVGTSGVRAAALDLDGRSVARAGVRFADLGTDPRDPEGWWAATIAALAALGRDIDLGAVEALAVDGTSGTVLAVDTTGRPVAPPLMYNDPCGDEAALARIDRFAPTASPARGRASALARALVLQDAPGAVQILHQADWIAGRLAGGFGVSDENNALKTGYDLAERRWPDWVFAVGVRPGTLPAVVEPGEPVCPVGPEGRRLGLPATAVVHAGTTDGCAAFLATGAAETGEAVTSLGSTLVIKLVADRPIEAPAFGVYSHRLGERWLVGGASNSGGAVIAALFPPERLGALTAALRPERPTGLRYYPLPTPGERFPINDPTLAPVLEPRPDDEVLFFQGVLEGISEIEALAYRRLAELGAPALRSVRTVGGGADNAGWTVIRQARIGVPFLAAASEDACEGTARLILSKLVEETR